MHILLVVSAKRYTGAAAVAEHMTRALHAVDVPAELLFLGGDNLQLRLQHQRWAHSLLVKDRSPTRLQHNLITIRRLAATTDLVICHLPHDHLLCKVAGIPSTRPLIRSVRRPRHLRTDPFHRWVMRGTAGLLLAYEGQRQRLLATGAERLPTACVPVPLDERFQTGLDGAVWRQRLGIPEAAGVVGMVGKMARGRGFELAIDSVARCTSSPKPHLLLVGHGELQQDLAAQARRNGIVHQVHFAGYQETELPELYAAMTVCLVPAPGSDYGHRVVSEAQGCGAPVIACPIPGIEDLIEDGVSGRIVAADATVIAATITELMEDVDQLHRLARAGEQSTANRSLDVVGRSLRSFLESFV